MQYIIFILLTVLLYSCQTSQYPVSGNYANKPKITIIGNYPENEKKILLQKLEQQVDDSLQVSKVKKKTKGFLGFIPHFVKVYHNFDSNSISRTKDFFKAAYITNGYFRGDTTTHTVTPSSKNSRAQNITFTVLPYQNHTINKISLQLSDTALQQLANDISNKTLLKKGNLYAQDLLDAERRRLVTHFRNNGYLYFTKEEIKIIADTVNTALLKIPNDPFEEQELLLKADSFNKNPTTDITIALKDNIDPVKLKKYYIGNVTIEPDNMNADTIPPVKEKIIYAYKHKDKKKIYYTYDTIYKAYFENKYKNKVFKNKIFLTKGDLYKDVNVEKTTTTLSNLNSFKQIIVAPQENGLHNDTVDFRINMLHQSRFFREQNIEGSYSQNNGNNSFLTNLYGINATLTFRDRNTSKSAIQSAISLNASVEFGNNKLSKQNIVNSIQGGINYSMSFPKVLLFRGLNTNKTIEGAKSYINTNLNYTSRLEFFRLAEFGLSYGSQFIKRTKNKVLNVQTAIPTIELKSLVASDSLKKIIANIPSLQNIYRSGIIVSLLRASANYSKIKKENIVKQKSLSTSFRASGELSGLGFKNILSKDLFSFVKFEFDKRFLFTYPKNQSVAIRLFAGFGSSYNQRLAQNKTMPFFRQFIGGGPNNMRAWTIRTLNSYSTRDKADSIFLESFGDIQAEANLEYRYRIGKMLGIPILGALFVDMGNIWNWKAIEPTLVPTNKSKTERLYDDIAIAAGTSIRFDLSYFIIRLDLGVKVKDPKTIKGAGGWFTKENFSLRNNPVKLQLGIGYPF